MKTPDIRHCRQPEQHFQPIESQRIIVLNSWDGPVHGVWRSSVCHTVYVYDLIDWEEKQSEPDVRIYALAPLPTSTFAKVVKALSVETGPVWPFWVPKLNLSPQMMTHIQYVQELVEPVGPFEWLLAFAGTWMEELLATRRIASSDLNALSEALAYPRSRARGTDWFELLGLAR